MGEVPVLCVACLPSVEKMLAWKAPFQEPEAADLDECRKGVALLKVGEFANMVGKGINTIWGDQQHYEPLTLRPKSSK